jgi:hypothetical protein
VVDEDDLAISNTSDRTAALTHWSFGQLATIASAPPSYLRTLPASIGSQAINYGLQRFAREQYQLFIERTALWTVHAITSPRYARVQHHELAARVLALMAQYPAWHLPLGYKDGEYGAQHVCRDCGDSVSAGPQGRHPGRSSDVISTNLEASTDTISSAGRRGHETINPSTRREADFGESGSRRVRTACRPPVRPDQAR